MEYVPFIATILLVALVTTAVINPKVALRIVMRAIAFAAAVIAVALLLCLHGAARAEETNNVYVRVGIIEYIDNENVCHIVDGAGVWWLWEKEPDDELNEEDLVGMLIQRTGNPNSIYDDCILNIYYGGIV